MFVFCSDKSYSLYSLERAGRRSSAQFETLLLRGVVLLLREKKRLDLAPEKKAIDGRVAQM